MHWILGVVIAIGAAGVGAPRDSAYDRLEKWFREYVDGKPQHRLAEDVHLELLRATCATDGDRMAEFERYEHELRRYLSIHPEDVHDSSPADLIAITRAGGMLSDFSDRPRFVAFADLLERFSLTSDDATDASIRLLLRVAAHDLHRVYSPRDWWMAQPFRPHLVRREARHAILRLPFSRSVDALLATLRDAEGASAAEREVAADLLAASVRHDSLAPFHRFRILETCFAALLHEENALVRAAAARAVEGTLDADPELELADAKLERLIDLVSPSEDEEVCLAVLRVLRKRVVETSIRRLAELLADPSRGSAPGARSFPVRVEDALGDTIDHLTPVTFRNPTDRSKYLEWYLQERAQPRFLEYIRARRLMRQGKSIGPLDKRYAAAPRFYGVPILGRRIVFVIDGSGSMQDLIGPVGFESKIESARKELLGTIERLDEETQFNVVTFSQNVRVFVDAFVPGSDEARGRARRFVRGIGAVGGTDFFGGVRAAVGIAWVGSRLASDRKRPVPDQIIVLSDGRPTLGLMTNALDIVEEVSRLNRSGEIRVDTIAFGADADLDFLRELAERNGGEMVVIPKPAEAGKDGAGE